MKLEMKLNELVVKLQKETNEYYENKFVGKLPNGIPTITVKETRKYFKILQGECTWGFVSKENGDLLLPASETSPAKGSRGNIIEGTDEWNHVSPKWLN